MLAFVFESKSLRVCKEEERKNERKRINMSIPKRKQSCLKHGRVEIDSIHALFIEQEESKRKTGENTLAFVRPQFQLLLMGGTGEATDCGGRGRR